MDQKILLHYQNWLQQNQNEDIQPLPPIQNEDILPLPQIQNEENLQPQSSEAESEIQAQNEDEHFVEFPLDSHESIKVFENNQIEVFVKKSFHQ